MRARPIVRDARNSDRPLARVPWQPASPWPTPEAWRRLRNAERGTLLSRARQELTCWLLVLLLAVPSGLLMFELRLPSWLSAITQLTIAGGAVIVVDLIFLRRRRSRRAAVIADAFLAERRCPSCVYDLTGLDPDADALLVCPECGAAWRCPPNPQGALPPPNPSPAPPEN